MRKINFKKMILNALAVTLIIIIGIAVLGKVGSAPKLENGPYAVISPRYTDSIIDGDRLSIELSSITSVASLTADSSSSTDVVLYFIGFIFCVVLINNILNQVKDREVRYEPSVPTDEASFKRLHAYLSHEQKNNLAIIRSRMEIAKDYEAIAYIDKISHSMDDVLTLSDEVNEDSLETVDVSLLVAEVCDDYKTLADIEYDFDENNNQILSKYQWIYRAMSNLIDNAVKFGEGKLISVDVKTSHDTVIISVKDRGIGIADKELEKIFKHEYRVDNIKSDGYGIGLSLVNRVCDLSQGVVWVESEVGVGTTFLLCFPALTLD